MCVVSFIGDHYTRKYTDDWVHKYPWIKRYPTDPSFPNLPIKPVTPVPGIYPTIPINDVSQVSRQEFEELRKLVLEMKEILLLGKKYDEQTNQPHCEHDEKVKILKELAKKLDVDLSEVFDHE